MARTQGILDWFRPPESKTLCPMWWDYLESDLSSNGRSEDVSSMKSHRVHKDPKTKVLLGMYEGEHQVSGEWVQGLEVKTRRHDHQKNPRPDRNQAKPTHIQGRSKR
jgi:hypothetical protein